MAELVVEGDELVLRLSWWEHLAAVHGNVRVSLSSVTSAQVEAHVEHYWRDPTFSIQAGGWRSLDTGYGIRGYGAGFVALRHWRRGRPAVLVLLHPPPGRMRRFGALLVTVADPEATAARVMDAKHGRGAEEMRSARVHTRRLWLPWRPRLRLIWAWPRALAYLEPVLHLLDWFDRWLGRTFPSWLRPVMVAIFLLPYLYAELIVVALAAEMTIIVFGASIYLVLGEWLLLALTFPFALAARLASLLPWPLVAAARPRQWTARVAGWGASGKAAADAAGALTSGSELAAPPWSPGARRAQIWM